MMDQFRAFAKVIRGYFYDYGGWKSLVTSPLFIFALVITSVSYSNWVQPIWLDRAIGMIPTLLGFSLGSYTILFSMMNPRLKSALRGVEFRPGVSYLKSVNATFLHFILIQVSSMVWAFAFSGSLFYDISLFFDKYFYDVMTVYGILRCVGSFIGHFLLVYSVVLIIASAMAVYRLAVIRDPTEKSN